MSRHDNSEFAGETVQRFDQLCFSGGIQRTGCFVQEKEGRPVVKRARQAKALALSPRQADPPSPRSSLKPILQFRFDKGEDLSDGADFLQARIVDLVVRHPERNVASDRVVDKKNFLRDIADRSLPPRAPLGPRPWGARGNPSRRSIKVDWPEPVGPMKPIDVFF